jgi:hypothetical protein
MTFAVGKFYKHTETGHKMSIIARVQTTRWGLALIAELDQDRRSAHLMPLDPNADANEYIEITREEWMESFS